MVWELHPSRTSINTATSGNKAVWYRVRGRGGGLLVNLSTPYFVKEMNNPAHWSATAHDTENEQCQPVSSEIWRRSCILISWMYITLNLFRATTIFEWSPSVCYSCQVATYFHWSVQLPTCHHSSFVDQSVNVVYHSLSQARSFASSCSCAKCSSDPLEPNYVRRSGEWHGWASSFSSRLAFILSST